MTHITALRDLRSCIAADTAHSPATEQLAALDAAIAAMVSVPDAQRLCKGDKGLGTACGKCARCLAAPQPAASISDDDRMELVGALGLLRGHRYTGCADALQRVLDADAAQPQPSGNAGELPSLGSVIVNEACWKFVEAMPHELPGPVFNDLKPALHAAVCHVLAAQPSGHGEVDSLGLELAAAQASEGHLSRLVDHLQVIAHDALAEMKRLHASLEPDDTLPGVPAYVSGESVEIFEDERVRLVRALRNGPTGGGATPGTGTSVTTPGDNAPVGGGQAQQDAVDAAFEAVRKKLCGLPKYSFLFDPSGVRRVADSTGNWIDFSEAHALFDPVAVDAARQGEGSANG